MGFEFWAAVTAGFAGGVVMSLLMKVGNRVGVTEMDMAVVEGAWFTASPEKAKFMGMAMHLFVMSALVIGTVYAALFAAFDISEGDAWWWGALFGVVHGVLGGVAMAALPAMHPRIGEVGTTPTGAVVAGTVELRPPGVLARNYGSPLAVLVAHVGYGLTVGAVYGWLV
jgi:hypothetical protein